MSDAHESTYLVGHFIYPHKIHSMGTDERIMDKHPRVQNISRHDLLYLPTTDKQDSVSTEEQGDKLFPIVKWFKV